MKRAYTIAEFCHAFPVGRSTTYKEIKSRRLKSVKLGRKRIILHDDAEAWLKNLKDDSMCPSSIRRAEQ